MAEMIPDTWQGLWNFVDRLVADYPLVVDRPLGSRHPIYSQQVYPLDYGYLSGTTAADGGGIDVWIGTSEQRSPNALLVTIDLIKGDAEIKILMGCTSAEMKTILNFMNGDRLRAALVHREGQNLSLMQTRRTIRRFLPDTVPQETIQRLLETAIQAPSAHNRQPWRFAVLTSLESKIRLATAMGADFRRDLGASGLPQEEVEAQVKRSYRRIVDAPVAILLSLDMTGMDQYPDPERQRAEYLMAVQSTAMAGENLLLAAHAEGLGGVWICAPLFAPKTARTSLDLPESWQPQGLLLLGRSTKVPEPRPRKPLDEVTRYL